MRDDLKHNMTSILLLFVSGDELKHNTAQILLLFVAVLFEWGNAAERKLAKMFIGEDAGRVKCLEGAFFGPMVLPEEDDAAGLGAGDVRVARQFRLR